MTRMDVIHEELYRFEDWRKKNTDYPESVAHIKYVDYLGWK